MGAEFPIDVVLNHQSAVRNAKVLKGELNSVEDAGDSLGSRGSAGINNFSGAIRAATPFLVSFGAAIGAKTIFESVEAMTRLEARVGGLAGNADIADGILSSMIASTAELGTSLETSVALYEALTIGAREFGGTESEILKVTETIQQLGIISGASATAQANANRQLSQALAGGIVRAEEFNSVIENTPRLAVAIANNIDGIDGSLGKLRASVLDGALTSETVFRALQDAAADTDREFQELPITMDRAFSSLGTNITAVAVAVDDALGEKFSGENGLLSLVAEKIKFASDEWARFLGVVNGGNIQVTLATQLALDAQAAQEEITRLTAVIEEAKAEIADEQDDFFVSDIEINRLEQLIEKSEEAIAAQENIAKQALERRNALNEERVAQQQLNEERANAASEAALLAEVEKAAEEEAKRIRKESRAREKAERAESQAEAAEERRIQAIKALENQLFEEEVAIANSYERRTQIILDNTVAGSTQQNELIIANAADLAERLRQLDEDRANEKREAEIEREENEFFDRLARAEGYNDEQERVELEREARLLRAKLGVQANFLIQAKKFDKLREKDAKATSDFVLGTVGNLAAGFAGKSKTMFEIAKAADTARATISGITAAVESFKFGSSIGGPYVGAAFAAVSLASTAALIQQIQSQSFGGGGGGSTGSVSVGGLPSANQSVPEAPVFNQFGDPQEEAEVRGTTIVNDFSGATIVTQDESEFADAIAPAMIQAINREVTEQDAELIPPGSRNAQDLAAGAA